MPTFVTFYGFAFEGAPTEPGPGWFAAPGVEHLIATRARTALMSATGEQVAIFRCNGVIEDTAVTCDEAERLYQDDASEALRWFTLHCARSVVSRWDAPELVREYLRTGDPSVREDAHACAWATSVTLAQTARLAARVAMYAASPERPIVVTREACRLTDEIAGDRLPIVVPAQERALASALLAAPGARVDAIAAPGQLAGESRVDAPSSQLVLAPHVAA